MGIERGGQGPRVDVSLAGQNAGYHDMLLRPRKYLSIVLGMGAFCGLFAKGLPKLSCLANPLAHSSSLIKWQVNN